MVIINRILIVIILLAVCVGSASAATSEGSAWGVTYWSAVDSAYDYSAMYSIDFAEVSAFESNVSAITYTSYNLDPCILPYMPDYLKVNWALYSGLEIAHGVSYYTVSLPADFGFTSDFELISSEGYHVGGGYVSVWMGTDNKLNTYYQFTDRWNYTYTSTHQELTQLNIIFTDSGDVYDWVDIPAIYHHQSGSSINYPVMTEYNPNFYFSTSPYDVLAMNFHFDTVVDIVQDLTYKYNDDSDLGYINLIRTVGNNDAVATRLGVSTNITSENTEGSNTYSYFTNYISTNTSYVADRTLGFLADIYTTSALDYPTFSFILDNGGGGSSGSFVDIVPIGSDPTFKYSITTDTAVYSPGDTVSVTYTTDRAGSLQVRDAVTNTVVHSKAFSAAVTNATWQFYIPTSDNYGYFDVYLLNTYGGVLDTVRYTLLPESNLTSFLHIVQPSINLFEEMDINVQAANESTFTLKDPNGITVFNTTISAQTYSGLTYVPTTKTGTYTAYLYDIETLTDTIIVYAAVAPDIIDENATIIEDVMREDETMTEYFDDKFREFAPTAWGIFLLSILLWFMSILVSFGGSGSKRRR